MRLTVWGKGDTSKRLAEALGVKRNKRRADIIIRYKRVSPKQCYVEINNANSIRLASHKYLSLLAMEHAGIQVPQHTKLWQVVAEDIDLNPKAIWFGRKFYHTQGKDIIVCQRGLNDRQEPENIDYYIKYIKPRSEYRYHVAFGKVILPTKKLLTEGAISDTLIRNHQEGKWKQVTCTETDRFSEICIKAIKAHGLDFGAVDFIYKNREVYVLEVNTAPCLTVDNRLDAYVKAFKENII